MAEHYAQAPTRLCAAIVAHADPQADRPFAAILDAHAAAARGRLRGVRRSAAWDTDPTLVYPSLGTSERMLADPRFADALRQLADRDLLFESWVYHPQIGELAALARSVPSCTVVLGHGGSPMGIGRHAADPAQTMAAWREAIARAAETPNLVTKIGGFAMGGTLTDAIRIARGLERWTTDAFTEALAPFVAHLIACFGAERCLFESNFPVDRGTCDYATLMDSYRQLLSGLSDAEQAQIFGGNAARVYRIAD